MNTDSDANNEPPIEAWADVGELRVRYLDWGGDGPPILALHGLASSAHWYDLVAPLLRENYRVIAPDQRGHGQTSQASNGYDWQSLASDAVGLMDSLGISQAAVFGHSWGGNIAINVAASFPERVSALVMIDGGFWGARMRSRPTLEEFKTMAAPRDVSGTRQEFLARMRGQLALCWSDEVERIVQTMVYEDEAGQMHDILRPDNHALVMEAMWGQPASDTWPHISARSLIVAAGPTPDRAGSDFARRRQESVEAAAKGIENNRVYWVPETIHDIGYHKPEELAKVIGEFLAEG